MKSSPFVGSFTVWDYVVFALMLLVSALIGVYYALVGRGKQSSSDFLMGGRSLTAMPVALSLTASFMSALTVLATPAEVYRYGASFSLICLSQILVTVISSEVFIPVFYRLGINSTYEYLEMRFSRITRLFGTALFILQTVLYTGIVIYTPALALSTVTGLDLWGVVMSTGIVCIFYCTIGGLKAVVWTDVFQVGIMVVGFLAVIIQSILLQGGISTIFSDAMEGGRLNVWDFDPSPLRRHTFWTITFGGTFVWLSVYGINQAQVQRYISCKSLLHARMAVYMNLVGFWVILLCSVFAGLCLFSFYKHCDPWTNGQVSAPDQLMPYFVLDILGDYPGLAGLFVAAAYSGTLSTVSSSVNALAAVTVEDLVKPFTSLSETKLSWTSKALSFLYGALCIGMAGLASIMGNLLQAAVTVFGIVGGPLLGLFSLGILCPWANSTGALAGVLSGLALSLWVGIGAQIYPPTPESSRPLPLLTNGCNDTMSTNSLNWTLGSTVPSMLSNGQQEQALNRSVLADNWYSLSYMYFSPMGMLTAIAVGLVVSLLTGGRKLKVEPELMLRKEDLACYGVYKQFKDRVSAGVGNNNLEWNTEGKHGENNLAFCAMELDTTSKSNGNST